MRTVLLLIGLLLQSSVLCGAETVKSAHTEAQLISEVSSIRAGVPFWTALHLKMDPHWHTYWRNPGDSGLATSIEWELPEGFTASPIHWPYPEKIDLPPLSVYAYEGETALLVKITPPENLPADEVEIKVKARWLACEVNCIPGEADLSLKLPVTASSPEINAASAAKAAEAREKLPLETSDWKIDARANEKFILIELAAGNERDDKLSGAVFFPYDPELIEHSAEQKFRKTENGYQLLVRRSGLKKASLESIEGILVSKDGWRGPGSEKALEIAPSTGSLGEIPVFDRTAPGKLEFMPALLFAFIGGMILNLMPCVFPVLSLKILSFVEQSKESGKKAWQHGVLFTSGVLVSFWVLACLLLFLRSAGEAVGWGFQLQSPAFIVFLALLFYGLGLNLLGVFEVGAGLTGLGSLTKDRHGRSGAFLSGVLASVVATPCTAPFMGSALGAALAQPPLKALGIFSALGFGMSFPYLFFTLFPFLLRRLPRPGAWMEKLKKFLSLFMFATAAWLVWVLSLQRGGNAVIFISVSFSLLTLAAVLFGRKVQRGSDPAARPRFYTAAVLLFAMAAAAAWGAVQVNFIRPVSVKNAGGIEWIPYSPEIVEKLRREGRPVLLDFTAAWCLTCHVNERVALSAAPVVEKFRELDVALVKADWTNRDEEITRALASFGRTSIPFYVLYSADLQSAPETLPEILTPGIVLQALERLQASNSKSRK